MILTQASSSTEIHGVVSILLTFLVSPDRTFSVSLFDEATSETARPAFYSTFPAITPVHRQ